MDIGSVAGIIGGFASIVISILLGGRLALFFDIPSIFIIFGGSFSTLLIAYPLKKLINALKTAKHAFVQEVVNPVEFIKQIDELAQAARKDGLLALEEKARQMDNEFMKKGILLVVDGTDPELVRNILETELVFMETRHKENQGLWTMFAEMGPSWGMIGTLIGLVAMLDSLTDPTTIGPKMAVALLTTLYGSVLANLLTSPIANKLKMKSEEEVLMKQLMIEGLLSIQAGENPRVIEEKLKAFLSPTIRKEFVSDDEA